MINNDTNQKTSKSCLHLYRGNKALIQKVLVHVALASVLLNCGMKQTFEESKRDLSSHSVPFTYSWVTDQYSTCNKQCGGGTQTRSLSCIRSTDNATVPNRHCSASIKPQTQRACNTQACPTYNWRPNSYSSCTKQCGRGTQTRSLSCIKSTDNLPVSHEFCSASIKPQTQRACNTQACPLKCTKKTLYKKLTATEDTTKNNQLDMLLVIDDSGSMQYESSMLAAKLNGFVNKLKNSGIDWQMCVTTTSVGVYNGRKGDDGRPIPWRGGNSGYILKKNSGNLNQIFIDTIGYLYTYSRYVGGVRISRFNREEGIKAMNLSVQDNSRSNCYRDKAALSVILISDEDESDSGPLNTPESFIQTVKDNFSPGKRLTVNSIVETWAQEYIKLSNLTGGSVQGIGLNDYTIALNDIHKKINQSLSGLPLACVPTGKPTVTVDGRDYPHVTVSGNQLFFNPAVQGPATIRGSYFCCGQ